jgi:hypothetical protein
MWVEDRANVSSRIDRAECGLRAVGLAPDRHHIERPGTPGRDDRIHRQPKTSAWPFRLLAKLM